MRHTKAITAKLLTILALPVVAYSIVEASPHCAFSNDEQWDDSLG